MKLSLCLPAVIHGFDYLTDSIQDCKGIGNSVDQSWGVGRSEDFLSSEDRMKSLLQQEKIVGGKQVEYIENWPFIGSLGGYCGGSLIGDTWFLTAGHCCASTPAGKTIYFGTTNPWADDNRIERRVVDYVLHPDFYRPTLHRDLCLIMLDRPIMFSARVKPICLDEEPASVGEPAFVAGWGLTSEGGVQSRDLMEVTVPVVSNDICQAAYKFKTVDDSMVCAGVIQGGQDGCQGDSGGPFVLIDHQGRAKLGGVVSWGVGCARPGMYGVYATIHNAIGFVHEAIVQMGGSLDDISTTPLETESTTGGKKKKNKNKNKQDKKKQKQDKKKKKKEQKEQKKKDKKEKKKNKN